MHGPNDVLDDLAVDPRADGDFRSVSARPGFLGPALVEEDPEAGRLTLQRSAGIAQVAAADVILLRAGADRQPSGQRWFVGHRTSSHRLRSDDVFLAVADARDADRWMNAENVHRLSPPLLGCHRAAVANCARVKKLGAANPIPSVKSVTRS